MVKKVLAMGLLLALGGCGGNNAAVDATAAGNATGANAECAASSGYKPLPGGLELGLNAHMRSDRIFKSASGATRRRVTYEVLKGSQQEAMATVAEAMSADGYMAEESREGKDGYRNYPYKKDKSPRLWVKFKDDVGANPANPAAKHLVWVEWQVKAAPKPVQAE